MQITRRHSAATALAGLLLLTPSARALMPGELYPVSGTPGAATFLPGRANDAWLGGQSGVTSFLGSENTRKISDDARYVVFRSTADGLSTADDDTLQNIYVQDRDTGAITLVNVPAPGGQSGTGASNPVISGDGRRVAFATDAGLSPTDTDGEPDVYLRDLDAGTTRLVSTTNQLIPIVPGAENTQPDLSHDGNHVSFTSGDRFSAADTDDLPDIYVANLATGALKLMSRATGVAGADSAGLAADSAISADGSAVAFTTNATDLDPTDVSSGNDVYLRSGTTTSLVSRATGVAGAKGSGQSVDPAISSDGTEVAFVSTSTNLAAPDASPIQSVFLRDTDPLVLTTVLVSRQSPADGGASADDISTSPTIAQFGGTLVAFTSRGSNLAAGLPADKLHVFVRSISAGPTTLVSRERGAGGAPATSFGAPSIASEGTAVAFGAKVASLSPEDDDHYNAVFVRDGNSTAWRSRPPAGTPWQGGAGESFLSADAGGSVSADGGSVAFQSRADGHVPANAAANPVVVRNVRTGAVTVASRSDGAESTIGSGFSEQISADGTKVVFASTSPLVPGTPAGVAQIYERDLVAGTTRLVSQHLGAAANQPALDPAISPDGRYVTYQTAATNFGAVITQGQVFLTDVQTGTTTLVSRQNGIAGTPAVGASFGQTVSADGTKVAFSTVDKTLDPADTDNFASVYVRDVAAGTTKLISRTAAGLPNDDDAQQPRIASNGATVVFSTRAKNLDPADTDGIGDLYSADLASGSLARVTPPDPGPNGVEQFAVSADGSTIAWGTRARLLPEDTDNDADIYAKAAVAGGSPTLVGRDGSGAPLGRGIGALALSADGGCLALQLDRSDDGDGPLLSPGIPGTVPSPDFSVVILRALTPTCVPTPPAAAPSGGSGGPGPTTALRDTTAPLLSKVSVSNKRFRRTSKQTALAARTARPAKSGTSVRFTLSEAATVTLAVEQKTTGRKVGKTCKKATPKLRSRKRCTRFVVKGTLTRKGLAAGARTVAFSGRLGKRALAVGGYRFALVAADAAGNTSVPARVSFQVVAR